MTDCWSGEGADEPGGGQFSSGGDLPRGPAAQDGQDGHEDPQLEGRGVLRGDGQVPHQPKGTSVVLLTGTPG